MFGSILVHPILGVYGYLAAYNINPLGQWWGNFLPAVAERYALLFACSIALGIIIHHAKLMYGKLFERQEFLMMLLVGIMWLSTIIGQGYGVDYNVGKMTKVLLILLMASHVITTRKFFNLMIWVFILSGLSLGYEIYSGGGRYFAGRLDAGVGGSDFSEGNFLAAHFAFLLPFIGILVIKSGWKLRALLIVSAAFIANSIILTRSRGTFLSIGIGVLFALLFSTRLKQHKKTVNTLIVLGIIGAVSLTDSSFWFRMDTLQVAETSERDASAQGRLIAWAGAWQMALDHPLGVGVGEFFSHIGYYKPEMARRDTHNTYMRCLAELGFHGLLILVLMIYTAFSMLKNMEKQLKHVSIPDPVEFQLFIYATRLALIIYLCAAIFITSIYIEEFYWLLMLPVFLQRALNYEIHTCTTQSPIQ